MVFKTRYLLLMAFMLLFLNTVNTTGEYILGSIVKDAAVTHVGTTDLRQVGARSAQFYATYFTYVNILGLVLQLFVVSRVVKYLGVPIGVMIMPVHLADGVLNHCFLPDPQRGAGGEGRGELDRLFDQQHHPQHAVPAVHTRAEIQCEAGDRLVLRPDGRRARRRGWSSSARQYLPCILGASH